MGLIDKMTETPEGEAKHMLNQIINAITEGAQKHYGELHVYQPTISMKLVHKLRVCEHRLSYPDNMNKGEKNHE